MTYDTDHFDDPPPAHEERREYEPGVYDDMPDAGYYGTGALGSTAIRKGLSKSIRQYRHERDDDDGHSDGMSLGNIVHWALLEPDRWRRQVEERPEPPVDLDDMSSTNVAIAKALAADGEIDHESVADDQGVQTSTVERRDDDPEIVELAGYLGEYNLYEIPGDETIEKAKRMRDSVLEHRRVKGGLLSYDVGRRELSIFWSDRDHPIRHRGRIDYERPMPGGAYLVDVKTTGRSLGGWKSTVLRGYGQWAILQAAHYAAGYEKLTDETVHGFAYILVENSPPHDTKIINVEADALKQAKRWRRDLIAMLADFWCHPDQYDGAYEDIERVRDEIEYKRPTAIE